MQELFMRYPPDSVVEFGGGSYRVLGYETYDNRCLLVCEDGVRVDVERLGMPSSVRNCDRYGRAYDCKG